MYRTDDGTTRLYISVTNNYTVYMYNYLNGTIEIDWNASQS